MRAEPKKERTPRLTGVRQGELIGLQWIDVDLQRDKLRVRRTIWRRVAGSPKGRRERTVDLPASAVDARRGHQHLRVPSTCSARRTASRPPMA